MYTAIVTGSRYYTNSYRAADVINHMWRAHNYDFKVKVGDCPTGIDNAIYARCEAAGIEYEVFRADWDRYGKKAGPIRNRKMVDSGGDICVAWPLDDSKGTKDCAEYAHSKNIPVWFPDLPVWAQWAVPIASYRED